MNNEIKKEYINCLKLCIDKLHFAFSDLEENGNYIQNEIYTNLRSQIDTLYNNIINS
jgi:hypothetical protein